MSDIQPYKELARIVDYDDNSFYSEKSVKELITACNDPTIKFIMLRDEAIAISSIKRIVKHKETGHESLPKQDKEYMEERIKGYKEKFAEYPSQKQIDHWIATELPRN